ncbi:hypothetical protein [Loktanella sp. 3ANDIMAR09]|uniref:hypothetical protein n=1 Tax=Loktanella sp. 3ANDIMAR09 TaxID=1225657 RepID=UPI00155E66DF|nr:hypothetical protein [Loktanella sp. 3ANDIMAR09]
MMTALIRHTNDDTCNRALAHSAPPDRLLVHLRKVSRSNRCNGYIDMFGACAALSSNPRIATQAASEVLMRCLSQALGRRPVLYHPDEPDMSFDEKWLSSLARSLQSGDDDSVAFLLHSRVPRHAHRNLVFLMRCICEQFYQI